MNKKYGWRKYRELTDKAGEKIKKMVKDEDNIEKISKKNRKGRKEKKIQQLWENNCEKG